MYSNHEVPVIVDEDEGYLRCPNCPEFGGNLHQEEVEAGWRIEDQDIFRHTSNLNGVSMDIVPADIHTKTKYGYRRQYLVIRFSCETCGQYLELCIYQHKGDTVFQWASLGTGEPIEPE